MHCQFAIDVQHCTRKAQAGEKVKKKVKDGALLHRTQSRCCPSWRAPACDGVCMLCHTGSARCSSVATIRNTPFQRRRHERTQPQRTSPLTTMSTRCPRKRMARSIGSLSSCRSALRLASSIGCTIDLPLAVANTIPPATASTSVLLEGEADNHVRQHQQPPRLQGEDVALFQQEDSEQLLPKHTSQHQGHVA